jgi:hypothetical protein
MAPIRSATKWTTHKKGLPMTKVRINQRLSLSLWAKNRSHRKEQSCYRSALSSAPCRRSGRSPALPYPPHEWDYSTISLFHPALRGHLYFANQGTFLLCIDSLILLQPRSGRCIQNRLYLPANPLKAGRKSLQER